jgi:hypothetical protein
VATPIVVTVELNKKGTWLPVAGHEVPHGPEIPVELLRGDRVWWGPWARLAVVEGPDLTGLGAGSSAADLGDEAIVGFGRHCSVLLLLWNRRAGPFRRMGRLGS